MKRDQVFIHVYVVDATTVDVFVAYVDTNSVVDV
jgi:hypothetical protein